MLSLIVSLSPPHTSSSYVSLEFVECYRGRSMVYDLSTIALPVQKRGEQLGGFLRPQAFTLARAQGAARARAVQAEGQLPRSESRDANELSVDQLVFPRPPSSAWWKPGRFMKSWLCLSLPVWSRIDPENLLVLHQASLQSHVYGTSTTRLKT